MWQSACGRFRVIWARSRFPHRPIPNAYYAWILRDLNGRAVWSIVSKHSKRKTAFNACEKAAAKLDSSPLQPGAVK